MTVAKGATIPVPAGQATFLNAPRCDDMDTLEADVAIIGVTDGVPYSMADVTSKSHDAPRVIREQSARMAPYLPNHDFDFGGPLFAGTSPRIFDCGDVAMTPGDFNANSAATTRVIASILDRGAVPIVLGGDDSVPIPVLRALDSAGPLHVLQVDAHLDFRDAVAGIRDGYSSPMRRASEMEHVARIVQVGLRGVGSARTADVDDARGAGNLLVTARQLRDKGVVWLLEQLPIDVPLFVAFDCDGLDPSVLPAVSGLSPGGLAYDEAVDLLTGAAERCRVVGAAFTELVPERDVNERSALVVVRLVSLLLAALARRA